MKSKADTAAANIDRAIDSIYDGITATRELEQLRLLFSQSLVSVLHRELTELPNTDSVKVRLDWIDKRPYADMTASAVKDFNGNIITRPVELGDAAIFLIEAFSYKGQIVSRRGKGLIIQAKVAPSASMARIPVTSLSSTDPDNSSNKEFALLSQWPRFELHLANNRRGNSLGFYALSNKSSPPPYGWYAAAPGANSSGWDTNGQWRSRWMCAPAVANASCDATLGEVLVALFNGSDINGQMVGEECLPVTGAYHAIFRGQSRPAPTDWDKLCTTLLELTGHTHQVVSGAHGVFASLPYVPWLAMMISKNPVASWLRRVLRKNLFPILIIERVRPD
ncbi:hypothetical protein [Aquipseudomonas alcaligenes]|uniref:hypothetical protein n=1 Tax=Aquipseudomonas alcaligenes TaxID=43263 RepID=UPI00165946E1|nr:hypothetical protein [Pseudomonas alcaligenes]